jgi:hypothetical protein
MISWQRMAGVFILLTAANSAHGWDFNFKKVYSGRIAQRPSISQGFIAATVTESVGSSRIYVGDRNGLSLLTSYVWGTMSPPAVISNGVVAFQAAYSEGTERRDGLFTIPATGGARTLMASSGPLGPIYEFDSELAFSNGRVAIVGDTSPDLPMEPPAGGVFVSSGGNMATAIVSIGDPAPTGTFSSVYNPALDDGVTAFAAHYAATGWGIFTEQGGALTTVVKSGDAAPTGAFSRMISEVDTHGGVTAFTAAYDSDRGRGVFVGEDGGVNTVAKRGDPTPNGNPFYNFGYVSTYGGRVAFAATDGFDPSTDSLGLYYWDGTAISEVIHESTPLFGSFVKNLLMGSSGLEEHNIVFAYELINGEYGVAIATPAPEMPSAQLAVTAALGCVGRLRSRRRIA